jgi:outer membrane protein OmpA-like peptidoglycan-associated protein
MSKQSALKLMTGGLILSLSLPAIASSCDEAATELNYQAYDSYRQGFPISRSKHILEYALTLCPTHAISYNNLAELFSEEGNYAQAIAHYRQALQLNPKLSTAWHGLGETYYKQKQFPLSLEAHLQACQTDKDSQQRVITLLQDNRYAITEAGEIINKESLLVLYDKQRRQNLNRLIAGCGLRAIGSATNKHLFRNLQFETGKATLKPGTDRQLDEIAATLIKYNRVVHIHGHTDTQRFANRSATESARLNWKLSQARANTVAYALDKRGVSIARIKTHAHGHHDPIVMGNHPAAFAKNRRVEIEME